MRLQCSWLLQTLQPMIFISTYVLCSHQGIRTSATILSELKVLGGRSESIEQRFGTRPLLVKRYVKLHIALRSELCPTPYGLRAMHKHLDLWPLMVSFMQLDYTC